MAADLNTGTLFGPYAAAGDPDIQPVTTRQVILVTNQYVVPLLSLGMKPKAAFVTLHGMVQQACKALFSWLHVAMVPRAQNQLQCMCINPLATCTFIMPQDQQAFLSYRLGIAQQDVPLLQPGMHHNITVLITKASTTLQMSSS